MNPQRGLPDREPAVRHDRFPPPSYGVWRSADRDDPITGLIAWTGFFAGLPHRLACRLDAGRLVGIAIGDVDDLKEYVERARVGDPRMFGHLAGNALMGQLGTVARAWLRESALPHSCLATFGGDEIVLIAEVVTTGEFVGQVESLRAMLCDHLPRTVSFAAAVLDPGALPENVEGDHWWEEFTVHAIGEVERTLFQHKQDRRREPSELPASRR